VRNPDLRRVQLAWAGSVFGNWGYMVALGVYAYQEGGPAAVGLVGVLRMLPSALAAPFVAVLGDRLRRDLVMVVTDIVRAALMVAAALVIAVEGPALAVYLIVAASSVVGTGFRPAQAALLPSLARTPAELTAANVASSTVESVGMFLGPALGGLLLAATNTEVVFLANAATFLWSAGMVARIKGGREAPPRPRQPSFLTEAGAGFRMLAGEPNARLLVSLYAAQTLVAGMLSVFLVVTALELLETGESGVGALTSAVGVGGLVGAVLAVALTARQRLGADLALGLVLFGGPLALVAAWPNPVVAFLLICLVGAGNTIVDVAAITLMQRTVPDEVLARVFGVLQGVLLGTMAIGSLIAPALVEGLGLRPGLVVAGCLLPLVALLVFRSLSRLDRMAPAPGPELELLRADPIFAPLPEPVLEQLASSLVRVEQAAGEPILRRGDPGDRYYIVERGEVVVEPENRPAQVLGPAAGFGEIALLRDVPRTADVTARTDVTLLALERDDFIAAVTGHASSADAADAVIAGRLDTVRTGLASA
jgi:MFS family permease